MATPAANQSPGSPRSRRGGGAKALSVSEESASTEKGSNGNAGRRRAAWKRVLNGATSPEIPALMEGESWPALSESAARAPSKPNPNPNPNPPDSYKALSDDDASSPLLSSAPQVTVPPISLNQRPANPNSTTNHTLPSGQRSMKRNGDNISASANAGNPQPPGPQGPVDNAYSNSSSPRDHSQRSSHSRSANDHPQPLRNSIRSHNGGPHSRGGGSYNHGVRRGHDRSNQDWNSQNFSVRDANMQPQRGIPRFMRHAPPPTSASFIPPQTFGNPFGYPEFPFYSFGPHPDPLRGVHFYPGAVPPFIVPVADPQLLSKIVNQINYYFSNENLVKDTFLRQNMDEQGWVPIRLIAGFNRVLHLTDNIQLILDAVRSSLVVEVQGERVRRRNDWMRWIMPSAVRSPNISAVQSYGSSSHDTVAENFRIMSLGEHTIGQSNVMGQADTLSEVFLGRSFSGDSTNQLQLSMNEETGPYNRPGDSSHSISARN